MSALACAGISVLWRKKKAGDWFGKLIANKCAQNKVAATAAVMAETQTRVE